MRLRLGSVGLAAAASYLPEQVGFQQLPKLLPSSKPPNNEKSLLLPNKIEICSRVTACNCFYTFKLDPVSSRLHLVFRLRTSYLDVLVSETSLRRLRDLVLVFICVCVCVKVFLPVRLILSSC